MLKNLIILDFIPYIKSSISACNQYKTWVVFQSFFLHWSLWGPMCILPLQHISAWTCPCLCLATSPPPSPPPSTTCSASIPSSAATEKTVSFPVITPLASNPTTAWGSESPLPSSWAEAAARPSARGHVFLLSWVALWLGPSGTGPWAVWSQLKGSWGHPLPWAWGGESVSAPRCHHLCPPTPVSPGLPPPAPGRSPGRGRSREAAGLVTPRPGGWPEKRVASSHHRTSPLSVHFVSLLCVCVCVSVCVCHILFELWQLSGDRLPMQKTQETWVCSLGQVEFAQSSLSGHPLVEGMAARSRVLAWEIPWTEGVWQTTVHRVAESDTAEDAHTLDCYLSMHPFICMHHSLFYSTQNYCMHICVYIPGSSVSGSSVPGSSVSKSWILSEAWRFFCGGGKTQILARRYGQLKGRVVGLLPQLCSLRPACWRVMQCFRVLWVQRRDGVHLRGAELGLTWSSGDEWKKNFIFGAISLPGP